MWQFYWKYSGKDKVSSLIISDYYQNKEKMETIPLLRGANSSFSHTMNRRNRYKNLSPNCSVNRIFI